MLELYAKIEESCAYIRKHWPTAPRAGIILGTGLGPLVEQIDVQASIEYESIRTSQNRRLLATVDGWSAAIFADCP